jgi:hypothetical protein
VGLLALMFFAVIGLSCMYLVWSYVKNRDSFEKRMKEYIVKSKNVTDSLKITRPTKKKGFFSRLLFGSKKKKKQTTKNISDQNYKRVTQRLDLLTVDLIEFKQDTNLAIKEIRRKLRDD